VQRPQTHLINELSPTNKSRRCFCKGSTLAQLKSSYNLLVSSFKDERSVVGNGGMMVFRCRKRAAILLDSSVVANMQFWEVEVRESIGKRLNDGHREICNPIGTMGLSIVSFAWWETA
jgi:DNA-directed RNA polymerase subunit N (RpoN/RPB10)